MISFAAGRTGIAPPSMMLSSTSLSRSMGVMQGFRGLAVSGMLLVALCVVGSSPALAQSRQAAIKLTHRTFVGTWYGHDREMKITRRGIGSEWVCCAFRSNYYWRGGVIVRFRLSEAWDTQGEVIAWEHVTRVWNKRNSWVAKKLHVGETRKIRLRKGIIHDGLTQLTYCDNAQDRRGGCGA